MKKTLLKLHWLSLDVAIGAVCGGVFFSEKTNLNILFALGISTWILYLIDRLLDIRQNADIQTIRHIFHQKNEKNIWILVLILAVLNLINLWFLPIKTIYFGLILGAITMLYAWLVFKTKINPIYFKEMAVSLIYTIGVAGFLSANYLLIFRFFLVVFQSLLIFSRFEIDENPVAKNMVSWLGYRLYNFILLAIFTFVLLIFMHEINLKNGLLLLMSSLLLSLEFFCKNLLINNLYRILGELIFWIPIFSILKND